MQFQIGVARRICETIGTLNMPSVAEKLGQMAAQAAMVEGLVYGMESGGGDYNGYYVPDRNLMYTAQLPNQGPFSIRYPRGKGVTLDWKKHIKELGEFFTGAFGGQSFPRIR